ncbi:MAG: formylglycine-generating enzyme family protein [Novosphingobium sp.]
MRLPGYLALIVTIFAGGCAALQDAPRAVPAPQMVTIMPGRFVAGSTPDETRSAHYPDIYAAREQPARSVIVQRPFALGRTEVTRGEFARFVRATGWRPDGPCGFLADGPTNLWDADTAHDWRNPGFAQTDQHPVVCVNLSDARGYAAWLSQHTGRRFRLPSGTEWEYAARAGTTASRWWDDAEAGGEMQDPCRNANVSGAERARAHNGGSVDPAKFFACEDGFVETAPVASFQPNPWGLHDMLGNVWEWTEDCLNADQAAASSDTAARTMGDCASHIDRGSSWTNSPKYVRAASQHPDLVGARNTVLGFRLAEDLP